MLTTAEFFEAFDEAGFLKPVSWTPSVAAGGGPVQTTSATFKAPTRDALAGEVLNNEYTITYPATALVGLVRGETISVDGAEYRVRENPHSELDGSRCMAPLSKV